jgi:hypothetical protein
MNQTDHGSPLPTNTVKWLVGPGLVVLAGALLLSAQVRSVLWSGWPYLILLLCPLMHVFMHRGHGGHGSSHGGVDAAAPANGNRRSAALNYEPKRLVGDTDNE